MRKDSLYKVFAGYFYMLDEGGKNVSPTPFCSPFDSLQIKIKKPCFARLFYFGGAEGNRTPVRKPIRGAFSERSLSLGFPT